jgi:hypothetical protein
MQESGSLYKHYIIFFFKNTHYQVLFYAAYSLFLQWFFIGYWILKTGLDVYPGPFFFLDHPELS